MNVKSLLILILINTALVLAFVFYLRENQNFIPLMIGILPLLLCNLIYVKELVAPKKMNKANSTDDDAPRKKQNAVPLLIMPVLYCIMLPSLIKFYGSLGWSPAVCIGFSVLLCLVLISGYGGVKLLLRARASGS
jgi:hypothetical protein